MIMTPQVKHPNPLAAVFLTWSSAQMDTADHLLNPLPEKQMSNHGLATVTRHSRPVKLWIFTYAEAVYMGITIKSDTHLKSLEGGVFFKTLLNQK